MIVLDQNKICIKKLKQNETHGMKKMNKGKIKDLIWQVHIMIWKLTWIQDIEYEKEEEDGEKMKVNSHAFIK